MPKRFAGLCLILFVLASGCASTSSEPLCLIVAAPFETQEYDRELTNEAGLALTQHLRKEGLGDDRSRFRPSVLLLLGEKRERALELGLSVGASFLLFVWMEPGEEWQQEKLDPDGLGVGGGVEVVDPEGQSLVSNFGRRTEFEKEQGSDASARARQRARRVALDRLETFKNDEGFLKQIKR